ncbi:MAG: choice-of-anchor D domain-containing protein [candidate division Zixibacteria bacterium]|nr:choice-of-anchor D domain-containing protein [candidate division Zixibacteria bacterium]
MEKRFISRVLLCALLALLILPANVLLADWSIVATYPVPEGASGLAFDGTNLYCGIYGPDGEEVYQIDPGDGSYSLHFSGPQDDAYGLTWDGANLWTTDHPGSSSNPAVARKLDASGNQIDSILLPDHYMSGIAYDNGDFWVATYYPHPATIYKIDSDGTVLKSFESPNEQPWDLTVQNGYLWVADYNLEYLYQVDTTDGTLIESHPSEYSDPAGVVWDGSYLWYCDAGTGIGQDYLYKIDLLGSGTPQIDVNPISHDFGQITIGESDTWNTVVTSVGDTALQLTGVSFSGSTELSTSLTFPITVAVNDTVHIPITWAPTSGGALNASAFIESNAPLTPSVEVTLTGSAVTAGADIDLPVASYDYGTIRVGASTRWMMTIINEGNDVLDISNISFSDPVFWLDYGVSLPLSLNPLDTIQVGVWFSPDMGMTYSATASIYSNDPDESPFDVSLTGSGTDVPWPIGDTLWNYTITGGYDNSPKAIGAIPDMNGDGVDDVVVCSEDDYIRCFNGNSHGQADLLWEHEIPGGSVYNQTALDFSVDTDEDGIYEVVVGAAWAGKLIRMISGATGNTIWTHNTDNYGDGGWVYAVDVIYDYNGDGTPDVLAAVGDDADDTGPKRIYCLDAYSGNPIWESPVGGPAFGVFGVEDFTGDGQPDVIGCASTLDETNSKAYGINGATGVVEWSFTGLGTSCWDGTQVDDFTGDGIKDIILGDFSMSGGYVYGLDVTTGDIEFQSGPFGTIIGVEPMDDVNGDGHTDVTLRYYSTTAVVIDGMTGTTIWSHALPDKPQSVAVANDVSGDGINDLFVGTLYSNNYGIFLDGTDGSELYTVNIGTPVDAIAAIPDIVGDNSFEMVLGGRNGLVLCLSGGLNTLVNDPPTAPTIDGPSIGVMTVPYDFDLLSDDPQGDEVYYYIEWGDQTTTDWNGPHPANQKVQFSHSYDESGTYIIRAKAKDIHNAESGWSEDFEIEIAFLCGDCNNDGVTDVSDAVYIITYAFAGGPPPQPIEAGDTNCDGNIDVSDAVYVINYAFAGGPAPCDPDGNGIPDC